jgi:hypothetical protein
VNIKDHTGKVTGRVERITIDRWPDELSDIAYSWPLPARLALIIRFGRFFVRIGERPTICRYPRGWWCWGVTLDR